MSSQIKAVFITLILFLTALYFFLGSPEILSVKKLAKLFKKSPPKMERKSSSKDARQGEVLDAYNGVKVYYNGNPRNVAGRNITTDGYNLGLKYQCVEFAKRYYYKTYGHKMPDSYGHAKDFFDYRFKHGQLNTSRGMYQFKNGFATKPQKDDLLIIGPTPENKFGHLMVVTKVKSGGIEIVQQNPGIGNPSRALLKLNSEEGRWFIDYRGLLGWLRIVQTN